MTCHDCDKAVPRARARKRSTPTRSSSGPPGKPTAVRAAGLPAEQEPAERGAADDLRPAYRSSSIAAALGIDTEITAPTPGARSFLPIPKPYWGGILPHSGRPGRAYRELARLGAEFERAGDLVAGIAPDADIAMVYSAPSKWLMRKHPPLAGPDGGPDAYAYEGIFEPFYRGAFEAGRQVRILHARQLHDPNGERPGIAPELAAERHPALIAPGLYVADDGMLDWLGAYADAGGHLVLGPRTGYGDHEARARHEVTPARLVRAAGVRYDEFSNLHADLPLRTAPDSPLQLPADAVATRWVEGLTVEDADVLAEYDHPYFGRWPAVTASPREAAARRSWSWSSASWRACGAWRSCAAWKRWPAGTGSA